VIGLVEQIVVLRETVDLYNPKVVQATMGSISRVNVSYLDLKPYLSNTALTGLGLYGWR
jgi:TrmH family RNA methyltransferase